MQTTFAYHQLNHTHSTLDRDTEFRVYTVKYTFPSNEEELKS